MARAFWWASLPSVRFLSVEASLLPSWRSCSSGARHQLDWVPLSSMVFCPLSTPGSLPRKTTLLPQVMALWVETWGASGACIPHSLGIWIPPYWSGPLPAGWQICLLGVQLQKACQQTWQIIHSASYCPCSKACRNILCSMTRWWGLFPSLLACPSRNSSTSIWHSITCTDRPSLAACSLAARDLSLLVLYLNVNSLWYLKKMRKHYSTWN